MNIPQLTNIFPSESSGKSSLEFNIVMEMFRNSCKDETKFKQCKELLFNYYDNLIIKEAYEERKDLNPVFDNVVIKEHYSAIKNHFNNSEDLGDLVNKIRQHCTIWEMDIRDLISLAKISDNPMSETEIQKLWKSLEEFECSVKLPILQICYNGNIPSFELMY
jgi:hypothetical protein